MAQCIETISPGLGFIVEPMPGEEILMLIMVEIPGRKKIS